MQKNVIDVENYMNDITKKKNCDNINGILTLNIDANQRYYSHKVIDFCPNCKDSFQKWLLFDEITVEDLRRDTNE